MPAVPQSEGKRPHDAEGRKPGSGLILWGLLGEKTGDNAQTAAVLEALDRPWLPRRIAVLPEWRTEKPRIGPSIDHVDRSASDSLGPPWPDLVVASGRRLLSVAMWIRTQSPQTRIVLVGRPHGHFAACDLIVAAPQYRLPPHANVVNLTLPLLYPSADAIATAAEAWRADLAAMARPLTAVLVGGPTRPFRFSAADAERLIRQARHGSGALFVVTSRRTPPEVSEALARALPAGSRLFRWDPQAARNPYLALLGLADRFVVTGDSASMMVEVARLGRPLAIAPLPADLSPALWSTHLRRLAAGLAETLPGSAHLRPLLRRLGIGRGRDLATLHRALYRSGRAVPLGRPFNDTGAIPADDDLAEVASRIEDLLRRPS